MGKFTDRFNLEKQLVFYMSYHNNPTNKFIHLLCIWPILITTAVLLSYTPSFIQIHSDLLEKTPFYEYLQFNCSAVLAIIYMVWYIALDRCSGTIGAFLVFWCYIFGNYAVKQSPILLNIPAWQIALPVNIFVWILQFIGHGVYEGRKPALLDSLDQALITAPMFVLLEVLFAMGFYKKLHDRVIQQVHINLKQLNATKDK